MPIQPIRENKIPIRKMSSPLSNIIESGEYRLTGVRPRFKYDANRQRTDKISGYTYSLMEMRTFSTFDVRVDSAEPVITQEEIEAAEDYIFVEIPEDETLVTPYKAEYGTMTVSIVAPYISVVTPS